MRLHHVSLLALLTLIVGSVSSPTTMARWLDMEDVQDVRIAPSESIAIPDIANTTIPLATTTQAITPTNALTLTLLSSYETNIFDDGAAEIATYDPISQTLFVVNANDETVDLLNISEPLTPTLQTTIVLSEYGEVANSVAFQDDLLAVAVENEDTQANGVVVFFERDGSFINSVDVGPLPDMLTFTPDGQKVLVANEGEPSDDYTNDPEGSISVIDISEGVGDLGPADVTTIGFTDFNTDGPRNGELDEEIRIFGPNATVAQDLEPEYITVSADSETAWVSLQENNALAILDLTDNTVTSLVGLGTKDHSIEGNGLDASDEDDGINIANWPLLGMYQPDAIATYEVDGTNYVITANEGDAREYIVEEGDDEIEIFVEEARVEDLTLDPAVFPNATELQTDDAIGRTIVTTATGNLDDDEEFEALYSFGTRSFSIFSGSGELVFDSGDALEQITAAAFPEDFNSTNDENDSFDSRSDAKGPEPEGVTVGILGAQTYAFVGLERIGGVVVYDVTDPTTPSFTTYVNNRDFDGDAEAGTAGDLGPEGLLFIPASDSPGELPLLVVANEVSGTTSIYEISGDFVEIPDNTLYLPFIAR